MCRLEDTVRDSRWNARGLSERIVKRLTLKKGGLGNMHEYRIPRAAICHRDSQLESQTAGSFRPPDNLPESLHQLATGFDGRARQCCTETRRSLDRRFFQRFATAGPGTIRESRCRWDQTAPPEVSAERFDRPTKIVPHEFGWDRGTKGDFQNEFPDADRRQNRLELTGHRQLDHQAIGRGTENS